jgi:hypothetical protein
VPSAKGKRKTSLPVEPSSTPAAGNQALERAALGGCCVGVEPLRVPSHRVGNDVGFSERDRAGRDALAGMEFGELHALNQEMEEVWSIPFDLTPSDGWRLRAG